MTVSVIIPTLNESADIAAAVGHAWRAGANEVLVVDGGSDDGTMDVVRGLECSLIESPPGRAAQQNLGASRATGEVVLFLHADNHLAAGAIEQIRQVLADSKIGGGAFRQRIEASGLVYRLIERGNAFRARRLGVAYGDQGIFVRRSLFDRLGGFPCVALMEDLIFMRRHRRALRLTLLPGPLHVSPRRWQRHGVVRQTLRNWLLTAAYVLGVSPDRLARYYALHGDSRSNDLKTGGAGQIREQKT